MLRSRGNRQIYQHFARSHSNTFIRVARDWASADNSKQLTGGKGGYMRVVIIGGSGHVGTYLVPRLVESGHQVINLSRGQRKAYQPHGAWDSVQHVAADRDAEDKAGTFGKRIHDLKPDVVIDMISFTLDSTRQIVDALRGQ